MFTAMSLGILQPEARRLVFSNAGMPYPIVKRGSKVWNLEVSGMPLGLIEEAEYEDMSFDMAEGDLVAFYSDGITEAENESEDMYGVERLQQIIGRMDPAMDAAAIVEAILQDLADFVGNAEQYDDMTVVAVKKL
jgi:sigma-B regulation protein RsbU (phosphoserine phosphatase)